jgi:selenocysteine lyase/cysteine desulfurase
VGPDSVRSRLRDHYGVEAAIGGFPDGGFLRLSHAVYTSDDDIERLRDAVLELV